MSSIPEATIEAAEVVLGITYTAAERAQMVNSLRGQIDAAAARRQVVLPNDAPMATRFDPRLPGFAMPHARSRLVLDDGPGRPLPSSDEDIAFAAVTDLARWIAAGTLTSARLTEIYLARIERFGAALNCWVTVTADLARAEAAAMDALSGAGVNLGPLHGIPYALKDLIDTKGIVTGWGAEPFRDRVPDRDATVVRLLREAGAVLLGKTAVGALARGDVWYGGMTRNPWNLNEGSSGSSAGSASATAAGLCGFAIGTETLGSIVSPSHRCGTTGLRPTYGRVSRTGVMALCNTLDKVGPIARSVDDCAVILAALNGSDPSDRCSIDAPFVYEAGRDLHDLVVGYLPASFAEGAESDRGALDQVRRLGLRVTEVDLPDLPYASLRNSLFAEAAAFFEQLTLTDDDDTLTAQDDGAWPNTLRKARFLSAVDHIQLDRLRYRVMEAVDSIFDQCDVLIGPCRIGPMLVASNFTGHPCLTLRTGFADVRTRSLTVLATGAPIDVEAPSGPAFSVPHGISLWGRLFDEGPMLNVGRALEAAFDVGSRRPTLPG